MRMIKEGELVYEDHLNELALFGRLNEKEELKSFKSFLVEAIIIMIIVVDRGLMMLNLTPIS